MRERNEQIKACEQSRREFTKRSRMETSLNVPEKVAFSPFSPYSPLMYPDTSAGDCAKNHQKCRLFRSLREFSGANRGSDKAFARSPKSALQAQTMQYQARFARQISSSLFSFGYAATGRNQKIIGITLLIAAAKMSGAPKSVVAVIIYAFFMYFTLLLPPLSSGLIA